MTRGLRTLLRRIRWLLADDHERRAMEWNAAGLDSTLRLDYDLDESSVVLDVGGYEGGWARDCFCRYGCRIEVFEPVQQFAAGIERRFERNRKVTVHRFGLAGSSRMVPLHLAGDRSSVLTERVEADPTRREMIRLVEAREFFVAAGLETVSLMKVNIEGGEYELLEHLLDTGLVTRIRDLQVQFHRVGPDSRTQVERLRRRLAHTHEVTYQEDFIWENWHHKER
jgi:FkbM family methyltransferase